MFDIYFLFLQRLGHSVGSYQRYAFFVAGSVGARPSIPPPPPSQPNLHPKLILVVTGTPVHLYTPCLLHRQ